MTPGIRQVAIGHLGHFVQMWTCCDPKQGLGYTEAESNRLFYELNKSVCVLFAVTCMRDVMYLFWIA